jgi:predicted amidohydrolase YtcJ
LLHKTPLMKIVSFLTLIVILIAMNACTPKKEADLLFTDGKIYTVDSFFTIVEAMAIKDGKILATGSNDDIQNQYASLHSTDLQGRVVYPGFIDAHCHFYGLAIMLQQADLNGAESFEEVIERLKAHRDLHHPQWLLGRGWDQNLWETKEFPDNSLLDKVFPDIPVVLTRVDGHAVIANSLALGIAGIDAKTKIKGGKLLLKNGKPTGVLIDNAANKMISCIPQPKGEELKSLLKEAQKPCFMTGLTTVADAGLPYTIVRLMEEMQKEKSLKINIYAMLDPSKENIDSFVNKGIYKTDRLHVCSIKLYADGALGSRGACLLKPYSDDPGNSGLMVETEETLKNYCRIAYDHNYQVCTHAIGDSAVRMVLLIYSEFLIGKNDKRWRIEHSQFTDANDFKLFGAYNIIPSVQPVHATSDMYWADERLGNERIKNAYAYRDLMEQNDWIPFGTDFPIEKVDPLLTFYAAVFRKDAKGFPETGFQMENAVTREEALRGITIWAAKSCFEEGEKGSLEPGKYADFVILDRDIMTIPEKEVLLTNVLKTFVRGELVFSSDRVEK